MPTSTATIDPAARGRRPRTLGVLLAAPLAAAVTLGGGAVAAPASAAVHVAPAASVVRTASGAAPAGTTAATTANTLHGQDVAWPQCPVSYPGKGYGLPMPGATARFVIIGLSGGRGFSTNPCLDRQVRWAKAHHLLGAAYTVPSYPTAAQLRAYAAAGPYSAATATGRLKNVGWAQARYAVRVMRAHGVKSPTVWVDVEPNRGAPWSASRTRNTAVVAGMMAGFRHFGHRPGIYSNTSGWRSITGGARFGAPEWRTVGTLGRARALRTCSIRTSLNGGPVSIVQWWNSRADYDVACPRVATNAKRLKRYFRRY